MLKQVRILLLAPRPAMSNHGLGAADWEWSGTDTEVGLEFLLLETLNYLGFSGSFP